MGEGELLCPEGVATTPPRDNVQHDALLITDEVQTGYGRTGKMFACTHYDVVPDIITQAKGIANGFPLGAFTAASNVTNAFESGNYLSTFGVDPVACAATLENIKQLQDSILENVKEKEKTLRIGLKRLEEQNEFIGDVRGLGLMYGIEIINPEEGTGPMNVAPQPDGIRVKNS